MAVMPLITLKDPATTSHTAANIVQPVNSSRRARVVISLQSFRRSRAMVRTRLTRPLARNGGSGARARASVADPEPGKALLQTRGAVHILAPTASGRGRAEGGERCLVRARRA